jgi:peptide/nickel transport system substrate-binding protein
MKRLRWQIVIVVLALLVIAALLFWQQPEVVQQVVTVQPATGGVYTEALIGSFGRLNPLLNFYNPADRDVNRLLFNGLVSFDDRGFPQGDLAESWGISQDGTIYNFSIREDATWHDGSPVTSEDVAFTVDLMRSEGFPSPPDIREFWDEIEVKDLDEKTLQFRLPEPFAPFLDYLTFGVLPKHILEAIPHDELVDASFNQEPVGTGPYRFDHLLSEEGSIQGVVLSAYDDYYRDRAFIDQVVFRYYPDSDSALAAYREGEVMGIGQVDGGILDDVLQESDLGLFTGRLPLLSLVYMNLANPELPFFQDPTIRRALLMGINRQWLVDRVLNSQAVLADGPIPPGTWAYYDEIERLNYDSETAIDLLKEAGYTIPAEGGNVRVKEDVALSFEMVYPDDPINTALAEAIHRDWGKLGVEVNIKPVTYEVILSEYLEPRNYQAALVALNLTRTPDPDPYPFWDQAQITGGQQEMPALPLVYSVYSYVVDGQVLGVSMGPLFDPSDRFATITSWFLLANRPSAPEITPSETPQ